MPDIPDEDYQHAQNVWNTFNIKNLGEYSNLYQKTDILLLCGIFEGFRDNCLETHGLDACNYTTAASLSWSAALKYTGVEPGTSN